MQLVEAAKRALERGLVELAGLDLDLVLVVLTEVAHVDRTADLGLAGKALLPQLADGALGDLARTAGSRAAASMLFERNACVHTLSTRMSASSRPSAENTPGYCGTISLRDAEQARDGRRVQRPGAAEGEEREVARVVAALERDHLDRARHVLVRDLDDRRRRARAASRPRRSACSSIARRRRAVVEAHPPGEEVLGVEAAEQQVRVGDGRLGAAAAVADRPRAAAPALRGPTRRKPPASTQAIEPPPAPIDLMSISGTAAGTPHSISYSVVCRCSPSTRMPTSALVPPMSSVRTFVLSECRRDVLRRGHAARRAGHHGLDRRLGAAPESMAPPFDFISVHSTRHPRLAERRCRGSPT